MENNKDIKDYLHLYLGCQFQYRYIDWPKDEWHVPLVMTYGRLDSLLTDASLDGIRLIIRPLSDMTEEEYKEIGINAYKDWIEGKDRSTLYATWGARQTVYLLKLGFDLFGLIEDGLAIDKSKCHK